MADTNRELNEYKENVKRGLLAHAKQGNSADWDLWEKYYCGKTEAKINVPYVFSMIRSLIPMTYFRNPKTCVLPRTPDKEAGAKVLASVLNYVVSEIYLKREMKRVLLDTALYGTGIFKLGYDSEHGYKPEQVVGPVPMAAGIADLSDETISGRDPKDFTKIEYNAGVRPGMPWCLRVNPREFVLDPTANTIDEAAWVAHRIVRRLADVKADTKYDKAATRTLTPNCSSEFQALDEQRMIRGTTLAGRDATAEERRGVTSRDEDWVELWEYRDVRTERIIVVSLGHDKFLRNDVDALQIDGLPYVGLVFNPNPKGFWGIPDAQLIHSMQMELNEIRVRQQEYRRLIRRRLMIKAGVLGPEAKKKFMSEDAEAFIEFPADVQDIKQAMAEMTFQMPPDIRNWSTDVQRDMEQVLGFGRNQMGQFDAGSQGGQSRRTATEANIVQQNSQIRLDERRDIVGDALQSILRKIAQIMFKFATKERVIRIAGPMGAYTWQTYSGPELQGEYDYQIEPDDALPMSRERRRQEAIQLYQTTAGNPAVNPVETARYLIEQFEGADAQQMMAPPQMMPGMMPGQGGPMGPEGGPPNADVSLPVQPMQDQSGPVL